MATSRSLAETSFTTLPSRRIVPAVTASRPATIRSAVVLPHPDGPTRTTNSPSSTKRSSECTASTPFAKTLVTCSSDRVAMAASSLLAPRRDPDPHPALAPVRPREIRDGEELRRRSGHRRRHLAQVEILALPPAVVRVDDAGQRHAGDSSQLLDRPAVDRPRSRVDGNAGQIGASR